MSFGLRAAFYGYDLAGNLTYQQELNSNLPNRTITNTYDAINRLQQELITNNGAPVSAYGLRPLSIGLPASLRFGRPT